MGQAKNGYLLRYAEVFNTENELKSYLKKHPDADRSQHSVKKAPSKGKGAPPSAPGAKKKGPPVPPPAGKGAPPPLPPGAKKKGPPPLPGQKPGKQQPPPLPGKNPAAPPAKGAPPAKPPAAEPSAPEGAPAAPAKAEHAPEHGDEHKPQSLKQTLQGLSSAAQEMSKTAPKAVKQFMTDPKVRAGAVKSAVEGLKKAPMSMVKNLVETARSEVHEFKLATAGVKAVMGGGKMSKHQKHAFKAVATHIAIGATAAALTASGPLAAAGTFAKGIARHIAAKSVHRALAKAHVLDEVGHIGHGVQHFMEHVASEGLPGADPAMAAQDPEPNDAANPEPNENPSAPPAEAPATDPAVKKKGPSPELAISNLVIACVIKELEAMTDDDISSVLNQLGAERQQVKMASKVMRRFASRTK